MSHSMLSKGHIKVI